MRSARDLNEEINLAREELDSIVAIADREDRELNKDESDRVVELADATIPNLQKKLATALKIEQERSQRSVARLTEKLATHMADEASAEAGSVQSQVHFASVRVPAKAKHHSDLQGFKGPDAERNAYIAGNVFLAGAYGSPGAIAFCRNHGLEVNAAMTTGTNSAGGFLVPDEMMATIIRLREERGVFPRYANRVPMGSDIIRIPRLLSDVTAYWVGEGVEITASDAALGEAELMARKIAALTKVSSELDEDSVVFIGDMVTTSMAYAMADKIDEAGFNGDGTSTYGGVLGLKNALDTSAIKTAATGNDAPNNLDLDDFEVVLGAYPEYTGANPSWFMHRAVYYSSCVRLMAAAGGNTIMTLQSGAVVPAFMGYPVQFVQVMHSTVTTSASTIVAYFGDLRLGASYGTRRMNRVQVSTERYFETDMIGIKSTERIAINVHERGDTIRNRPILALKTAA